MAFFNKAGNILRQTVSKHINHEMSAANSSIFQMIRCMSSSKVFVGGLSFSTDEQSLGEAFNAYGQVQEARVIVDRETGRSRGFGFVTFADAESASAAIQAMDQRELHGRTVRVNYANDRSQGGGFRGGGGYGGGGYGSGGGGYGGGGGGYGGGGGGYGGGGYGGGGGGYGGGNNYGSGGDGSYGANSAGSSYGGEGQNSSVAGGFGANDGFPSAGPDAGNSFAAGGGGFNSGDQFGSNGSSNLPDAPVDNDEPEDFARRA